MAQPTYISTKQWQSVLKALAYSFVSGFLGSLTLMAADFIKAAQTGGADAVTTLAYAAVAGAVVGGINAAAVFLKKLFTSPEA